MLQAVEMRYRSLAVGSIFMAVSWKFAQSDFFVLPWPSRQILPGILERKGLLEGDFYAESARQSVYDLSTHVVAFLFSDTRMEVAIQFSLYSAFAEIVSLSLATILIYKFLVLVLPSENTTENQDLLRLSPIALPFIALYLFAVSNDMFHLSWPHTGGWRLPLTGTFNPQGFSWWISVTALLLWRFDGPYDGFLVQRAMAPLLVLVATFCHPVIPATIIATALIFALIVGPAGKSLFRASLTLAFAWVVGVIFILVIYAEPSIPPRDLYNIYAAERHPHHYVPSSYVTKDSVVNFCLFLWFSIVGLALLNRLSVFNVMVLFIAATMPHVLQYVLVEQLQVPAAVKFGPSRVIFAYNLVAITLITSGLFAIILRLGLVRKILLIFLHKPVVIVFQMAGLFLIALSTALLVRGHLQGIDDRFAARPGTEIGMMLRAAGLGDHAVVMVPDETNGSRWISQIYFREIGGMPVFVDYYFPFSEQAMLSWYDRQKKVERLAGCLAIDGNFEVCIRNLDSRAQPLVLLSTRALTSDSLQVLERNHLELFATSIP